MPQKNVFISYAHEDSELKDHFLMHLRPLMFVEAYVDEALIGRGDEAPFFVVW